MDETRIWWAEFTCRLSRGDSVQRLAEAATKLPGLNENPIFQSMTNAVGTRDCQDSADILLEINTKLSANDPTSLERLLAWYDRRFLKPPTWSMVLSINGQLNAKQGGDLASQILKEYKKRSIAKVKSTDASITWDTKSDPAALCRQLDTKAILLLDLLPGEVRSSESSIGKMIIGEVTIRATIIRPGKEPLVENVQGVYKDFGNKNRELMLSRSFEEAASTLTQDPTIAAALGIQLMIPPR